MTDITKYRNVSLTHETYKTLINLSKVLLPDAQLSISKTIESIANEKAKKLNGKIKKSDEQNQRIQTVASKDQVLQYINVLIKGTVKQSEKTDEATKKLEKNQ